MGTSKLREIFERMSREELPNLFRLYLNPFVAQTCFTLERYVQSTWHVTEPYQTFLANSFDEALSGAIKLARYHAKTRGMSPRGLVIDPCHQLGPFASAATLGGDRVEFVPGLTVIQDPTKRPPGEMFGFIVIMSDCDMLLDDLREIARSQSATLILCVNRDTLAKLRSEETSVLIPDIVIFDETFVGREVPFGAFTARTSIYDHWNTGGKSTFHSTTFQPNTISTLQFMHCLRDADPSFHAAIAGELARIETDLAFRKVMFRRLVSPSLSRAIALTGCETGDVRARGHYVLVDGRPLFDAVGGVACSIRGHNPPNFAEEMESLDAGECERDLARRLHQLTALDEMLPAVSGAGAIENALRLALVVQAPRRHVLALKSGFGGKTLLALTGTWKESYKEHISPLYADVSYVDPFAVDALDQIDAVLAKNKVAVVQIELIQGVGGVRRIPEAVARHLDTGRKAHGYLLLIDEVQTGMFRTGPFTLSRAMGITPDLLAIGKAISDMMFPFALTLYSSAVAERLARIESDLPHQIRIRYSYAVGYKTAHNVLRLAEQTRIADQVAASGDLFERLLKSELRSCTAVRDIRVHGLLIGIELDDTRWPQRWFKKRLFWFYLAALLRHPRFPLLVGFCQAEPNVLKITPPLTVAPDEIRQMCSVIGATLRRPFYRLLASAVGGLMGLNRLRRMQRDHTLAAADATVSR